MDKTLLGGLATIRSLPVVTGNDAVSDPARRMLPKGELAVFLDGPEIHNIAVVEFRPGVPRGNHVHPMKRQWMYVQSGSLHGVLESQDSKERSEIELTAGDLIVIEPNCAHAFMSDTAALAIEASDRPYEAGDTQPIIVMNQPA